MSLRILSVIGCRPNFIKIAPLAAEMKQHDDLELILVHTGQHYDNTMSAVFFRDLEIPRPDVCLNVGSGSSPSQMAAIVQGLEGVLLETRPDLVLVVGDVNTTVASSLTAISMGFPVAHVEAGLRSFDREMPEEINRVLTDAIADFLFATERSAVKNLLHEGKRLDQIFFTGNVMIDTLILNTPKVDRSPILDQLALCPKSYALVTLHRASNVDDPATLSKLTGALAEIQRFTRVVFPVHPRTAERLKRFDRWRELAEMPNIKTIDPLGYIDFIKMMKEAQLVLTDSGGVQEETTFLGVPCLTLRENTERPVTVTEGTNQLVGTDEETITEKALEILDGKAPHASVPENWDGHAAQRIVLVLRNKSDEIKQLYSAVRERKSWQPALSRV